MNTPDKEDHCALQHLITTSEDTTYRLAKKKMKLLFVAGDTSDGNQNADSDLPDFLQELVESRLDLKQICRNWIRKYLLNLNHNINLFVRVPKLGLPDILTQYMLYDMTLEDDDDDDDDDANETG